MYCRNCGKQLIGSPELCMNCGAKPLAGNSYCNACGAETNKLAEICIKCGAKLGKGSTLTAGTSTKSRLAVTLLSFFLGELGVHRFYAGKIGTGVAMLILTIVGYATVWIIFGFIPLAAVWVWNLVDFIMAIAGKFKDKEGNLITNW
jgi:TM2 domain-containing membrane protein YozV